MRTQINVAKNRLQTAKEMRFEEAGTEIELINGMADNEILLSVRLDDVADARPQNTSQLEVFVDVSSRIDEEPVATFVGKTPCRAGIPSHRRPKRVGSNHAQPDQCDTLASGVASVYARTEANSATLNSIRGSPYRVRCLGMHEPSDRSLN